MNEEVCAALRELNRCFYDSFAEEFAASRGSSEPGLQRALSRVLPGSRVLDLGCGQGRVRALLPDGCLYTGVDYSAAMLAQAMSGLGPETRADFVQADIASAGWVDRVAGSSFDWIVLRAVLHHIPGYEHRLAVLRQAGTLLSDSGCIVLANWQFLDVPRLRRRVQPWLVIGVDPASVESGDFLLDWQRGGTGYRYVHLVDEVETLALAADAGLSIRELFRSDGHDNRLSLYALLS